MPGFKSPTTTSENSSARTKWCLSLLCICAVYCSTKCFYGWPPRENALLILLSLTSTISNRICMSLLCAAPQATSELQHFLLRLSLVLPHFIQKFLIDLTTYLNKRPNTNQLLKMKLQARQFFCLPSITLWIPFLSLMKI